MFSPRRRAIPLAILCALLPATMTTPTTRAAAATVARPPSPFGKGRGLNLATAVLAKREGGADTPAVYQIQPNRFSPAILQQAAGAGFDFVRMVTTPAPLMTDDAAARQRAIAWLTSMIDAYQAAGLGVVVDLHFWPTDTPLTQDTVLHDPAHRAAFIRGQVELARALAKRRSGRLALELINEPPCTVPGQSYDWPAVQRSMVTRIRAVAPTLPLVLTACRADPQYLLKFDAAPYRRDPNLYWTFHYYRPATFVWQQNDGVRHVPFPPRPALADSPAARAAMLPSTLVNRRNHLAGQLDLYLRKHRGAATIAAEMAEIASWARRQGIDRRHIFVGEFATGLTQAVSPDLRADELRWYQAVRDGAVQQGFGFSYWTLPGLGDSHEKNGLIKPETLRVLLKSAAR